MKQSENKQHSTNEPISTLASKIVQTALKPDTSIQELSGIAKQDPAFAIRLLSLANSSLYSLRTKVSDVNQAASLIGIRGLKNLAFSLLISDMLPPKTKNHKLLANCIRRAVTAQLIARSMKLPDDDDFFTIGLLLDSSLLSLARNNLETATKLADTPANLRIIQEKVHNITPHNLWGFEIATEWRLPEKMALSIKHHHDPHLPSKSEPYILVAWLSEQIAGLFEGGDIMQRKDKILEYTHACGLSSEIFDTILTDIPTQVEAMGKSFEKDLGPQVNMDDLLVDANRYLLELNQQYEMMVTTLETVLKEKEELEHELRSANAELEKLATTDPLTGLNNRRSLLKQLERELALTARRNSQTGIVLLDIDYFKKINDTYGHLAGDLVLKVVAQSICDSLRSSDIAGRYGGEEFLLVLPDSNLEGTTIAAERLRKTIADHRIQYESQMIEVKASFGVTCACGCECIKYITQYIAIADENLYKAKNSGRNQVIASIL